MHFDQIIESLIQLRTRRHRDCLPIEERQPQIDREMFDKLSQVAWVREAGSGYSRSSESIPDLRKRVSPGKIGRPV